MLRKRVQDVVWVSITRDYLYELYAEIDRQKNIIELYEAVSPEWSELAA